MYIGAEALVFKRQLWEALSRARTFPDDSWALLFNVAHADHHAVENFLAVTRDDGTTEVRLRPERRPVGQWNSCDGGRRHETSRR